MASPARLERLRRLRTRLRERAVVDLARRAAAVAAVDAQTSAARAAEAAAWRAVVAQGTGANLALAWTWAEALARRTEALAEARASATAALAGARARVEARRREEEPLGRLAARTAARRDAAVVRAAAAEADELGLWAHGRKR